MKFLYIFVVAVILGVAHVKADMKEELEKLGEACMKESHVTEEELKAFFLGGMKDEAAKESVKCHMKCVMEKQGHFKNGALDEEATKKFLQTVPELKDKQDLINKAIGECKALKGANDCESAYLVTKCMAKYKSEM